MTTVAAKAEAFAALHRGGCFVIPNPWDVGTARMLALQGFAALATTSAGFAFSIGRPDGAVTREQALDHAGRIVAATDLPVSADLENGYGDAPATCAETVRMAADVDLAGCSIEDATGRAEDPIYPFDAAVARVKAAVAAARGLTRPFTLTARAENFLHGRADLDDTIRRLQAFAEAGADVLYAPGLRGREAIEAVVRAVAPKPVNVIMGEINATLTMTDLAMIGVRRVSLGSSLACAAYGAFLAAAEEVKSKGTFTFSRAAVPFGRINGMFKT